jgi:hypothetical protein
MRFENDRIIFLSEEELLMKRSLAGGDISKRRDEPVSPDSRQQVRRDDQSQSDLSVSPKPFVA